MLALAVMKVKVDVNILPWISYTISFSFKADHTFLPAAKLSGLREQFTLRRRPSVSVSVRHHLSHQSQLSIINCGYTDIVDILGEN